MNMDPDIFRKALAEFEGAVGPAHVKWRPEELAPLAKATIPQPRRPGAVVYPGDSQEVEAVVRIARHFGIPLWPCSKGRNWGYGSATPVEEGTVVLHLERLNRILEVNDELAYAVIEPGVTYRQLREHLDRHHPDLWCDCTDGTPHGSVLGNALDRGLGTTHYADHFGTLCGLEVILPSGETLRTGGGVENCHTWHTHKWGVGPYIEGLFSQSNFGVVVKAGVWLMPRPGSFVSFTFDLARADDLPQLVDTIRRLSLEGVISSAVHLINDVVTLSVLAQYSPEQLHRYSRLPPEELARMRQEYGVSDWSFGGGIQGRPSMVRAARRELRRALSPLGRLMFVDDRLIGVVRVLLGWRKRPWLRGFIDGAVRVVTGKSPAMLEAAPEIHGVLKGIPSDYFVRHAYFKSPLPKPVESHPDRDDCGITWLAPIVPMTGEHVSRVVSLCKDYFDRYEFDFYVALLIQNPRSMIVLTAIFFRKDDAEQCKAAESLYQELSSAIAASGYQAYRVGTPGMRALAGKNPQFHAFLKSLKNAADPGNLLAPGKYGL